MKYLQLNGDLRILDNGDDLKIFQRHKDPFGVEFYVPYDYKEEGLVGILTTLIHSVKAFSTEGQWTDVNN